MKEKYHNEPLCRHGNSIGSCQVCLEGEANEVFKDGRNTEIREIVNPVMRLAECVRGVVNHIKNSNYNRIIVSGGSREVPRILFERSWMKMYPTEQCPPIDEINSEGNSILYKTVTLAGTREDSVRDWMSKNLPDLLDKKDEKICFLDEYAYTGSKINGIKQVLKEVGFKDIEFVLFASSGIADLDDGVFVASSDDLNTTSSLSMLCAALQGRDIRLVP